MSKHICPVCNQPDEDMDWHEYLCPGPPSTWREGVKAFLLVMFIFAFLWIAGPGGPIRGYLACPAAPYSKEAR